MREKKVSRIAFYFFFHMAKSIQIHKNVHHSRWCKFTNTKNTHTHTQERRRSLEEILSLSLSLSHTVFLYLSFFECFLAIVVCADASRSSKKKQSLGNFFFFHFGIRIPYTLFSLSRPIKFCSSFERERERELVKVTNLVVGGFSFCFSRARRTGILLRRYHGDDETEDFRRCSTTEGRGRCWRCR